MTNAKRTLFTSDRFISAIGTGADWREAARAVLEQIESVRTEDDGFNLGFLYISDVLSAQASSILTLLRSVTKIEHWVGSAGVGVCGTGHACVDKPAISVLLGRFEPDEFKVFPASDLSLEGATEALTPWLDHYDTMLTVVHGDNSGGHDPATVLAALERLTGGFLVGGMTSSRAAPIQFADECVTGGLSGVCFNSEVEVATTLTQGCAPLGKTHTITRCDDNAILELDGQKAMDVFTKDMEQFAAEKAEARDSGAEDAALDENCKISSDTHLFKGEVHVAFPVSGSDLRDYQVRNILALDNESGSISVAANIQNGDRVMLVQRDCHTISSDLSRALLDLRSRVQREHGGNFNPKGALYISCVARASADFVDGPESREMMLVRDVIGDVPMAGFYAMGEISNQRLYGYTAILILFL